MFEYVIVGLLVLAAAIYAVWRLRRTLAGRGGCDCAFMRTDAPDCADCESACPEKEDEKKG